MVVKWAKRSLDHEQTGTALQTSFPEVFQIGRRPFLLAFYILVTSENNWFVGLRRKDGPQWTTGLWGQYMGMAVGGASGRRE